jgi:hypothetical protein
MAMHYINQKKRFAVIVGAVVGAMLLMTLMAFAQNRFGAI